MLRLFDVALIGAADTWGPALAALAVITIVVGNVGAIGQSSLKRLLAYSSVAQAGYMLAGVVVSTRLGIQATIFYLAGYVLMNLAAFAVIVARERESEAGDDISSLYGLGADRPLLAWPMTIAMLALAGFPATVGFFGKLYLIEAAVDNEYAWLGVVIVIGSAISLVYYLRVIAAVWMRPAAGRRPGLRRPRAGRPARDGRRLARGRRGGRRPGPPRRHHGRLARGGGRGRPGPPPAEPARGRLRRRALRAPPPSRSASGPTRSSTSPATRARRSPRWSSACRSAARRRSAAPANGNGAGQGGGERLAPGSRRPSRNAVAMRSCSARASAPVDPAAAAR